MTEKFEFTDKIKKPLIYMMLAGLLGLVAVFFMHPENHHARFWTNLLTNAYFFSGIALFGLFVVAATQLAYGGWQTLLKRVFISMSAWVRVGGALLVLILVAGLLDIHPLYDHAKHIVHEGAGIPKYSTKIIYFGSIFWVSRVVAYAVLWFFFSVSFDKFFAQADQTNPATYKKSKLWAAAFIVVFAVTESAVSWDMIMSLDPHWFSTLFGWYNFASYGCAAWAMSILLVLFLKSQGYLAQVNENHIHDLGKFLFGFSIFWTYLWFSQFMLQWYANIPEDTNFWVKRFNEPYFKVTIFGALIINFLFPLFFLIRREAKRNFRMISFGAVLLIFGHYVDFFNYTSVEPNWNSAKHGHHSGGHEEHASVTTKGETVLFAEAKEHTDNHTATDVATTHDAHAVEAAHGEHGSAEHHVADAPNNFAGIGLAEILVFIGFLGAFLFMFFMNLAKRNLVPENDPYLKEAQRHHVTWA